MGRVLLMAITVKQLLALKKSNFKRVAVNLIIPIPRYCRDFKIYFTIVYVMGESKLHQPSL